MAIKEEQIEYLFTSTRESILSDTFTEREFHDVFLTQLDITTSNLNLQKEEVSDAKFVSLEELKDIISLTPSIMRVPENMNRVMNCIKEKIKNK